MNRTAAVIFLVAAGCGGLPHPPTIAIRTLRATAGNQKQDSGVLVLVEPITSGNWQKYPEVVGHVGVLVKDQTAVQVANPTQAQLAAGPQMVVRYDDIALVPLPAFRVHIANRSGHPLKLDGARARLDDGQKTIEMVPPGQLRGIIEADLLQRSNNQGRVINEDQLVLVRQAVEELPMLKGGEVPSGGDWQGVVAFRFESEQPVERVSLTLDGLSLDGASAPAFRFPFLVEHKRAARVCKDGSTASLLGACPGDEDGDSPAMEGPCVQKTRNPQNDMRKQWWIGSNAVADSDLNRTLMAQPASRAVIERGLIYRGVGYGLIMVGIGVAAASAVAIGRVYGAQWGPIGLSGLAVSVVGGGFAVLGSRRTDDAVNAYNQQSDATGVCAPVW